MAVYRKRNSEKIDVYEVVTDQVTQLLEAGTIPWRRPWKGRLQHPQNAKSGAHYRGINPFILEVARLTARSFARWACLTIVEPLRDSGRLFVATS